VSLRITGVMTGTSCDGLDACSIEIRSELDWSKLWSAELPYPQRLRKRVMGIQKPRSQHSLKAVLELHRDLGSWYGSSLARLFDRHGRPDAVANHGQTVAHFPAPGSQGTTLQLGDPARIAALTGITVISKFRDGDMAAGGQGAPLAPQFHRILAATLASRNRSRGIAIHNLGGISNLTYLPPDGGQTLAFDTGPANVWIDLAASEATRGRARMDRDGRLAARGEPDEQALKKLLSHPFLRRRPPKSTGRDDFPFEIFREATRARGADRVRTATELTVRSVADAYRKWILGKGLPLETIYLSGGGARNPALVRGIAAALPEVRVASLESAGIDPQSVEATAFAFFGYLTLKGRPLGGAWTGARGFGPPGEITPGENWSALLKRLRR
jgi:anhydro-N-acetylmuramic acid kinase